MPILLLVACTPDLPVEDLGPAGLLGRRLAVGEGPAWVECTSPADREERHLAETDGAELELYGLLADTRYECVVHAGKAEGTLSFRTDPLPEFVPLIASGSTRGYTLSNTQHGIKSSEDHPAYVFVADPEGQVRWLYDVGPELVCDIDAQFIGDDAGGSSASRPAAFHVGGGWASFSQVVSHRGVFRDLDLAGEVLFERTAPEFGEGFNHHCERLEDGTTLSLTASFNTDGVKQWVGVGVELWSPERGVEWSWTSQGAVDLGLLPVPQEGVRAPYTANAVALVEDPWGPGAWVSSYSRGELWRVDRETGEITHLVPDQFTVVDPEGNPLPPEELPYTQHDPEWRDGPLGPDTRVLMYENGNGRPGGSYSRVVEYDVDLDARVLTRLWDWTEAGWWNPTLGDADRLANDHVLVAQGFNHSRTPDSDDVSEIVELDEAGEVVWRLTWGDPDWPLYRAERIDPCALFANARYCPDVADRLEALEAAR